MTEFVPPTVDERYSEKRCRACGRFRAIRDRGRARAQLCEWCTAKRRAVVAERLAHRGYRE